MCEAMSLGSAIERSDGSFEFEKGFLRHAVDAAGEAVFEAKINEMPVRVVKMFFCNRNLYLNHTCTMLDQC